MGQYGANDENLSLENQGFARINAYAEVVAGYVLIIRELHVQLRGLGFLRLRR